MLALQNQIKQDSNVALELNPPDGAVDQAPSLIASTAKRFYRRNVLLSFLLMAALLGVEGFITYKKINAFIGNSEWVDQTNQTLDILADEFSELKDVESNTRGFVLYGKPELLEPMYLARRRALDDMQTLKQLTADNPAQQQRIGDLERHVREKLELAQTVVTLRQHEGFEAALEFGMSGKGRQEMDEVRLLVSAVGDEERNLLKERDLAAQASARSTVLFIFLGFGLSFSILVVVYLMIRREGLKRMAVEDGLARTNAKLEEGIAEMGVATRQMRLVGSMGEMLQSCLTFEEAGKVISSAVPQLLPGTAGALSIINASKNLVQTVAAWGDASPKETLFAPDECWALRRGRLHHAAVGEGGLGCEHVKEPLPHGSLCLPLVAHGETLGVLHLRATRPDSINESAHQVVRTITEQFSLTFANLRLQHTLRTQSVRDPLTGLFNRRYMEESLERELLRARRHETPLSVIMLDIDHFKRFNDTFGHAAGDVLIQEFGKTLKSCACGEDIVCRYGGEEFIIILPGASLETARQRAAQINKTVRRIQAEYKGQPLASVTASLGVAARPEHSDSTDELVAAADAALYDAKRLGRDRVVVAPLPDHNERSFFIEEDTGSLLVAG